MSPLVECAFHQTFLRGESFGHCSLEIRNVFPDPVRRVRTTRSSSQSHPFQVMLPNPRTLAHKSSFIPRASQLWNSLPSTAFSDPTTFLASNVTSTNLILSPFLPSLSHFSFVGALL